MLDIVKRRVDVDQGELATCAVQMLIPIASLACSHFRTIAAGTYLATYLDRKKGLPKSASRTAASNLFREKRAPAAGPRSP